MKRTATVESKVYRAGRSLNRRLRKQQQREDAQAEHERRTGTGRWDMTPAQSDTVRVDINGTVVLMDRHTAYALMHSQQARLVIDLDAAVEYVAVNAP